MVKFTETAAAYIIYKSAINHQAMLHRLSADSPADVFWGRFLVSDSWHNVRSNVCWLPVSETVSRSPTPFISTKSY